ncbi:MAG: hypothetical protein H6737_27850 [Alphaproteobacteria bacterium]|nr:hypothetical protein [Alphaproteobacteria bacterium]
MSREPEPQGAQSHPEGHTLFVRVRDEVDVERFVPLFPHGIREVETSLQQRHDDQGFVELRLVVDGNPLGTVRIDLPPRPRGERVDVSAWMDEPGELHVVLTHEGRQVHEVLRWTP